MPDIEPPNHPQARSQTTQFANAALTTPPPTNILQTPLETTIPQQKEGDTFPKTFLEPPIDVSHPHKPRIIPIIANLQPKYPTKHEGILEDPFPLIPLANSVTDPTTGKQLEYKQLINHPDPTLRRTWQCSSANEFG